MLPLKDRKVTFDQDSVEDGWKLKDLPANFDKKNSFDTLLIIPINTGMFVLRNI